MARNARIREPFGVYHIRQTGSGTCPLFKNDDDRRYFLEILKRAQDKYGFKLYAYCMLEPDAYHIILEVQGSDLSSIMKSINIGYAMHVGNACPLFKDRYKSKRLDSLDDIRETMRTIHRKGGSGNIFSSSCHYSGENPLRLDWIKQLGASVPGSESVRVGGKAASDECRSCIRTLDEAKNHLDRLAREGGLTTDRLLADKDRRNKLIRDFRRRSTLSLKEIGTVFGNLSESMVSKILSRH